MGNLGVQLNQRRREWCGKSVLGLFCFPLSYPGLMGRKSAHFDVFALPMPVSAEHCPLPVLLCTHNLQVFINTVLGIVSRSAGF